MEGQNEMGFIIDDQFDPINVIMSERVEFESENNEIVPKDVPAVVVGVSQSKGNTSKGTTRKRPFHRHTPYQIQELENFFNNCAHPDEKQRLEIGRRLGLQSRQVKFWFQNRRTQMKTQIERHENESLKQQYDKLLDENIAMKNIISNPICQNCGGPAILGDVSMEDQELRIENAHLKDELIRVSTIAEKFRPISDLANQITTTTLNSVPNLSSGRNGSNGLVKPMGLNIETGVSSNSPMNGSGMTKEFEKTAFMQAGVAAMDELLALAETDSPLWFKDMDGREILNVEEYSRKFSPFMGVRPSSLLTDATRETSSVFISSLDLVETMMFPTRWKDMFPCLVGKSSTIEILFMGKNGTQDGELQLMNAEFLFPSPFVPLRQEKFLRFTKQHSQGMWAVVDVSLDTLRESSYTSPYVKWRRLPSGCIIQDAANGYSLVTWIEHSEYDDNCIHQLYRPLLNSGWAFGAPRWLTALQRERECAAILMSPRSSPETDEDFPQGSKRSIIELMKRISNNFSVALCGSSLNRWQKLQIEGLDADVSIMSRVSMGQTGEPSGLVLSVSTSVWMPIPRQQLFTFMRDEKQRGKWDVLANGGPMEIISRLSKSHDGTNLVLLLCPPAAAPREKNMLIIQESWSDHTGSFLVYAPVDATSMQSILTGADSTHLGVLPSGFSICDGPIPPNATTLPLKNGDSNSSGASVFTMGFQILISSSPTAELKVESVETVKQLLSTTIAKIRASLGIN